MIHRKNGLNNRLLINFNILSLNNLIIFLYIKQTYISIRTSLTSFNRVLKLNTVRIINTIKNVSVLYNNFSLIEKNIAFIIIHRYWNTVTLIKKFLCSNISNFWLKIQINVKQIFLYFFYFILRNLFSFIFLYAFQQHLLKHL